MFVYKGMRVNLEDVNSVFGVCSEDIRDELRLAALDDTPIAPFIEVCGNDSYKLGQFRLALRDMLPSEYLCYEMTGQGIYYTREAFRCTDLAENLLRYIKNINSLTIYPQMYETLAEFTVAGVDISHVDFTQVKKDQTVAFCKGLNKGYPMWLLQGVYLDDEGFHIMEKAMQKGIDIHQFLDKGWSVEQLYTMLAYSDDVNLNDFLSFVNPKFTVDILEPLLSASSKGIPLNQLAIQDSDGYPVYNQYQLEVLVEALSKNVITPSLFDPSKSDMEMRQILVNELSIAD